MSAVEMSNAIFDHIVNFHLRKVTNIIFHEEDMACECKNEEGDLLPMCLGICGSAKIQILANKRVVDLEEKIERLFGNLHMSIRENEARLSDLVKQEWKSGFTRGFALGLDVGRDMSND